MSNVNIAMKAVAELNKVLQDNEENLVIKKLKGLKKVRVDDVYAAQVYAEAIVMGKQPPRPVGTVDYVLKKFNIA